MTPLSTGTTNPAASAARQTGWQRSSGPNETARPHRRTSPALDRGDLDLGVPHTDPPSVSTGLASCAAAGRGRHLFTRDGAEAVVAAAMTELGGVDILINNVGAGDATALSLAGFLDTDDQQWHRLLDLNLFSAVRAARAALLSLLERRGAIVNTSSINSRVPATGPVGYSEAKAALTAFGKRLSEEFGPQGVRVNTVSPGVVGTALWRVRSASAPNSQPPRVSARRSSCRRYCNSSGWPRRGSPSLRKSPPSSRSSSPAPPPTSSDPTS